MVAQHVRDPAGPGHIGPELGTVRAGLAIGSPDPGGVAVKAGQQLIGAFDDDRPSVRSMDPVDLTEHPIPRAW